jgi:hypothetical protein
MSKVKIGSQWKTPTMTYVKVDGSWRIASLIKNKVSGSWRVSDLASPPPTPTLSHTALGQFTITNYNSALDYVVTNGTRSGAVITVPTATSTMNVTAAYAAGAPVSAAAYGERKAYTYHFDVTDGASYYHAPPADGYAPNFGVGPDGSATYFCQDLGTGGDSCYHNVGVNHKDNLPSGYTDQFGEWFKIY